MRMIALVLLALALPPRASGENRPTVPVVLENHCGFEYGCDFVQPWVAIGPLNLFRARQDTTLAFTAAAGDSLSFVRADLVIDSLGSAVVVTPFTLDLGGHATKTARGDTLRILEFTGEGWFRVWTWGRYGWVEMPWCAGPESEAKLLAPPVETWWALLRNAQGSEGWLPVQNTNTDGCGFDYGVKVQIPWLER